MNFTCKNHSKSMSKNHMLVGAFLEHFGLHLGGVLELFFATFGHIFQFAPSFCDFFSSWKAKLLKFARHGGLEALEVYFGIHFGGTLLEKGWILGVFWVKKWVDVANGTQNWIKVKMVRRHVQSFRRASRSPAVQVTGSAYALSRWEGASPLGGVWGGVSRIGL